MIIKYKFSTAFYFYFARERVKTHFFNENVSTGNTMLSQVTWASLLRPTAYQQNINSLIPHPYTFATHKNQQYPNNSQQLWQLPSQYRMSSTMISQTSTCSTRLLRYSKSQMSGINITQRGGALSWGNVLHSRRSQFRFPMVSPEFFIDMILPAALWPTQPLTEMSTRNISWGVNAASA